MATTGLLHIGISNNKFFSYSASSPAIAKAINSDPIVDLKTRVYFLDFQEMVALARVNKHLLVDLDSSGSDIQLALLYPSSIEGYFS